MPARLVSRYPFSRPCRAIHISGKITPEKPGILRRATVAMLVEPAVRSGRYVDIANMRSRAWRRPAQARACTSCV